jgi:ubiquinone/menaquinone biosynthesis C-methylase UbiE
VKGEEWYQADDIAETYEDKRFSRGGNLIDRREKAAVMDALGDVDGKNVLEIACGTGRFTVMLSNRGANAVGLDISEPMLRQGRDKLDATRATGQCELLRGDAGRLPFPDNQFDTVFAMRFFHLADTPASFLKEMHRVSRDQVFFDTFNRFSTRSLYNWALPMGSRLYSGREVDRLLSDVGLELERAVHDWVFPYGFYRKVPNAIASAFRTVDGILGRSPFGPRLASVSYWDARV